MSKRPTEQQFETALMWLSYNDGEYGEAEACKAVAKWIEGELTNHMIRNAAKKAGVPVAAVRAKLQQRI
jgi:hypothetical protein